MQAIISYRTVLSLIGKNMYILSASFLTCAGIAAIYSESLIPFALPAILTLSLGFLLQLPNIKDDNTANIQKREASLTVTLSWVFISVLGCTPYLLSGAIPSFMDALFESVSGFTTTGSSILSDIEALPKSILFWRSMTHWIGGIGIIVLVIIVMPTLKIGGYHLFSLESS